MRFSFIAAIASALIALSAATQAAAQAGIQVDNNGDPVTTVSLCTLGQSCGGISLGSFVVNGVNRLYVYQEGVIGFGAQLNGSIAGGLASLTGGDYFAPTFGTPLTGAAITYMNNTYSGMGPGFVFLNLFTANPNLAGAQLLFTNNSYGPGFGHPPTGNNTVTVGFRYGLPNGCIQTQCIAFTAQSEAGFRVGDTTVAYGVGLYPPGSEITLPLGAAIVTAPEPGTWALMILGFGAVGAVARRRRPAAA